MKKPFILVDIENRELIIIIKSVAKVIPFGQIGREQDFIDELYRRYKSVHMVNKYSEVDRKSYLQLIEDLREQHESPFDVLQNRPAPSSNSEQVGGPVQSSAPSSSVPSEGDLENSTLVRCAIEKRFSIDDLGMKFNTPYDYYDLSIFDQEKVKKSTQLTFFLKRGVLVKTTFDEIAAIRNKCLKEREKVQEARRNKQVVERKDILGDEDEGLVMSDEEMKTGLASADQQITPIVNVDMEGSEAARLVSDFFGGRSESILSDGMDSDMKSLVRSIKS